LLLRFGVDKGENGRFLEREFVLFGGGIGSDIGDYGADWGEEEGEE